MKIQRTQEQKRKAYHGGVVHGQLLPSGDVDRLGAHLPLQQLVDQADVGKGPPRHHLVIPPAAAIGVEVPPVNAPLKEVPCCWAVPVYAPCWGDVVGGDAVAEEEQAVGVPHAVGPGGVHGHALEIWRLVDVR